MNKRWQDSTAWRSVQDKAKRKASPPQKKKHWIGRIKEDWNLGHDNNKHL